MNKTRNSCNRYQENMKFCKLVYQLGKIFCTVPWYDFQKGDLKRPFLNKLYAVVYGLALGTLLAVFTILLPKDYGNIFEIVLSALNVIISVLLMEHLIFRSVFIDECKWRMFLKIFSEPLLLNEHSSGSIATFCLQLILGHTCFIAIACYHGYEWNACIGEKFLTPFVVAVITEYYCVLYVIVSGNFVVIIKCFYEDLNRLLEAQTKNHFLNTHELNSDKKYETNILEIGERYRYISEIVKYYNDIFGWATLLVFWHTQTQNESYFSWSGFLSICFVMLLSLGESVYIILCCELASSAGKKTKRLCLKLQENFDVSSRSRKELFKLADIVRTYKPKFTAANFFVIKKGTILGIINIATTHLIVIIQFYGTVRAKYIKEGS